jgi:dTDP-4-amino-4,6-dideoxygalactose transaminase
LVNVHYIPIHLQPYYRALGFQPGDFPNAERYYSGAISLPMYYELSDDDVRRVASEVRAALGKLAAA